MGIEPLSLLVRVAVLPRLEGAGEVGVAEACALQRLDHERIRGVDRDAGAEPFLRSDRSPALSLARRVVRVAISCARGRTGKLVSSCRDEVQGGPTGPTWRSSPGERREKRTRG